MKTYSDKIKDIKKAVTEAECIFIGAGAGLSAAAGLTYSGERFDKYFSDFKNKYGITDMYSGGFYPFETQEEFWAWWSRHIYVNRYLPVPYNIYEKLLELVKNRDYFVLTTNVDHCFQKAGFNKERLFYTQGDYGLFQCCVPCCQATYDNEESVKKMCESEKNMKVPAELIPKCPVCGKPMTTSLRIDDKFVQDKGWYAANRRYEEFAKKALEKKTLYFELGVGYNTPVIIKYPFWRWTLQNKNAVYVCVNMGEADAPREIAERSVCINGDIKQVIGELVK